jgi:hypothetical protein
MTNDPPMMRIDESDTHNEEVDFKQELTAKNPKSIEDAVETAAGVAKRFLPHGVPYPGARLGNSPVAPFRAVDITAVAPGTEVKDPYTDKIFLVP